VDSNLTINSNVTVTGTVIVTGNLVIGNKSNVRITPSGSYPAAVAGVNVITAGSTDITFDGLVYAGQIADLKNADTLTIDNGAIVAGLKVDLKNTDNVSIAFPAAGLDPPYFSGGGGGGGAITITSWQGNTG
jgi:bacillopeptidase F (M6 metalloprotease family)